MKGGCVGNDAALHQSTFKHIFFQLQFHIKTDQTMSRNKQVSLNYSKQEFWRDILKSCCLLTIKHDSTISWCGTINNTFRVLTLVDVTLSHLLYNLMSLWTERLQSLSGSWVLHTFLPDSEDRFPYRGLQIRSPKLKGQKCLQHCLCFQMKVPEAAEVLEGWKIAEYMMCWGMCWGSSVRICVRDSGRSWTCHGQCYFLSSVLNQCPWCLWHNTLSCNRTDAEIVWSQSGLTKSCNAELLEYMFVKKLWHVGRILSSLWQEVWRGYCYP